MANQTIRKVAVDEVAASYWKNFYADSGYGELWVREIPNRITAELKKLAKTASADQKQASPSYELFPLATVVDSTGVSLEGIAVHTDVSGKRVRQAFVADFDHKGSVKAFDTLSA